MSVEHSPLNRAGALAFKVGDRVRCVSEPVGNFGQPWNPTIDGEYIIAARALFGLDIEDPTGHLLDRSCGWLPHRFELVEPTTDPAEWTPGDGWREVPVDSAPHIDYLYLNERGRDRWWVREEPVPPLPTRPWTVIRVTWKAASLLADEELTLHGSIWRDTSDGGASPDELVQYITGFEVLSEPHSATAQHLIDAQEVTRRETVTAVVGFIDKALHERRIRADGLYDVLSNARHEFRAAS